MRLNQNEDETETPEMRQEVGVLFCEEADQQTRHEEQQKVERNRNSLAESAEMPAALSGDLSQLKIWVNTS